MNALTTYPFRFCPACGYAIGEMTGEQQVAFYTEFAPFACPECEESFAYFPSDALLKAHGQMVDGREWNEYPEAR